MGLNSPPLPQGLTWTEQTLTLASPGAGRGPEVGTASPGVPGVGVESAEQDLQRRLVLSERSGKSSLARRTFGVGEIAGYSATRCPLTHPGRAAAVGKWQRQWKAAAQCAHRNTSVPSPHTLHRALGAGPCRGNMGGNPARVLLTPPARVNWETSGFQVA
jgi:hypothetical protein